MLYVKKNASGEIEDFAFTPKSGFQLASFEDPDFKAWLQKPDNQSFIPQTLERLDLEMARAMEDLIEVLIEKGLLLFTDLPEPVQNKILFKRSLRNLKSQNQSIIHEDDLLF